MIRRIGAGRESEEFEGPDHTALKVIHAGFGFASEKGATGF